MTSIRSQDYPRPIVEKALNNNTLYPMEVLEGTKVFVKYPGMVETQTIRFYWKGPKGHGNPVFEELPGSERGIVEFQVSALTIGACIGKTVHVGYNVVENNQTTPSHELELEVQFLEPIDLPAADLPDRVENNDGDLVLDLHTFSHDPGVVLAQWPFMTKGQLLWIEAIGQRNYPSETKLLLLDAYEVNESNVEQGIRLKIPRSWVRSLDNYSAMMIRCYVSFDGDPNVKNAHELPHTTCNLRLNEFELDLPAPGVDEAQSSVLDPHRASSGATLRIDWPGLRITDWVCAHWGSETALECKTSESPGTLIFHVPANNIRDFLNRTVEVWYTVARDGQLSRSPSIVLSVLDLSQLPPLVVTEANSGVLDLNTFVGDARLTIVPWDFAEQGDETWLKLSGVGEGGTPHDVNIRVAIPLLKEEVAQGLDDFLPRDILQSFANGSELMLQFWSTFDGRADWATAKAFPPLVLSLITERFTDTELFTGQVNELISEGQRVTSPAMMDIEFLSGAGQAGIFTFSSNVTGMREGASIVLCLNQAGLTPPQRVRLRFRHGYLHLRFAWTWGHESGKVFYCDAQDADLGSVDILGQDVGGTLHQWIELSAPEHQRIYSVVIEVGDYSFFDFFTMFR